MRNIVYILIFVHSAVLGQNTVFNGVSKNSMLLQGKDTTYLKVAAGYWSRLGGTLTPKTATDTIKGTLVKIEEVKISKGKGLVDISPDSAIRLHGTSTVWDDLFFPMSVGKTAVSGYPPFVADSGYYQFTVDSTGTNRCIMYFTVQLPHSWKEGDTLHPHVHYKHTSTSGTPTFVVKYRWANITGVFGAYSWVRLSSTTGTTVNTHQLVEGGDLVGTGKTFSSIIQIQLYLQSSTVDNKCDVYQFDIHFAKGRLGTNKELSD